MIPHPPVGFKGLGLVPEQALDRDDEVDVAVLLDLGRDFALMYEDGADRDSAQNGKSPDLELSCNPTWTLQTVP